MVKAAKGERTRVGEQSTGRGVPSGACPPIEVRVATVAEASVRERDPVTTQVRDGRVRLLRQGQVVAWVDNEDASRSIKECHKAGGRYEGHVVSVTPDGAVVSLEGPG